MLKYRLDLVLPLFVLITAKRSFAFDPYSAAMAAESAYSFMNKADEAADVGFALTDLLEELGQDSDVEEEMIQSSMNRIEGVYSKTRELGWLGSDLSNSINYDLRQGKSLTKKIKALKNTIQSSKKIATIMGFRPKAGEKAARIQEIKINSMMLEELQAIRRAQYLAYLENQEAKHKRDLFLKEILESGKSNKGNLQ
ncbi:hypothetical protein CIK05_11120 [Bdellovibrio sp. qaytius]|nr:hypothetical protein CIK05_11120 [Bdellovibrio sp. qaytius]